MNKRARALETQNAELDGLWIVLAIASYNEEARTGLVKCTSPAWERAFLYKRTAGATGDV